MPIVKLIDYTGNGNPDPDYAARLLIYTKSTRLEQGEDTRARISTMPRTEMLIELSYISNTLRSSWEFVDFVFEIRNVTRAFTHQLVRTRTASYAQQAQRVVDMSGFSYETPECIEKSGNQTLWANTMATISDAYAKLVKAGVPKQDARGLLPTNVHTNIIMKLNLRTLADLVSKRQNLRAQGEYADVVRMMSNEALTAMPWLYSFLYPQRTATPVLDKILKRLLGSGSPIDNPEINEALKELDKVKAVWG